jgi:caspase 7
MNDYKMYNMNHEKRGVALVINIRSYDPPYQHKERVWSVKDFENLQHTFKYLEFDFEPCENLTAKEIRDKIQKITKLDHTNSDFFLCVVMSHGNEDYIIASDNRNISYEEIIAPIKQCPKLIGKPKLFFFQACRGENEMVNRQDSDESTSSDQTETEDEPKYKSKMNRRLEYEADLLVNNATLPDHYAFGTMNEGSVFVNSVCAVLNEAYKNLPNNIAVVSNYFENK